MMKRVLIDTSHMKNRCWNPGSEHCRENRLSYQSQELKSLSYDENDVPEVDNGARNF